MQLFNLRSNKDVVELQTRYEIHQLRSMYHLLSICYKAHTPQSCRFTIAHDLLGPSYLDNPYMFTRQLDERMHGKGFSAVLSVTPDFVVEIQKKPRYLTWTAKLISVLVEVQQGGMSTGVEIPINDIPASYARNPSLVCHRVTHRRPDLKVGWQWGDKQNSIIFSLQ